jgi:hypothetical protein
LSFVFPSSTDSWPWRRLDRTLVSGNRIGSSV